MDICGGCQHQSTRRRSIGVLLSRHQQRHPSGPLVACCVGPGLAHRASSNGSKEHPTLGGPPSCSN
eukprot:1561324-Prymnesium_polylepis.1